MYFYVQNAVEKSVTNNPHSHKPYTTHWQLLMPVRKMPFENIEGKGENPGDQYFLLFQQFFLSHESQI